MPNYAKVVTMIKKEFPEITSEEIDEMISQIPPNMPTVAIKPLLKLAKVCSQNPDKLEKLKKISAKDVLQNGEIEINNQGE